MAEGRGIIRGVIRGVIRKTQPREAVITSAAADSATGRDFGVENFSAQVNFELHMQK
jgi:hypothetical protein